MGVALRANEVNKSSDMVPSKWTVLGVDYTGLGIIIEWFLIKAIFPLSS